MELFEAIFLVFSIAGVQATPTTCAGCLILTDDILPKSPLIIHYNNTKSGLIYAESSKKRIELKYGDSIRLGCPNSTIVVNDTDVPTDTIVITCMKNNNYIIESTNMAYKEKNNDGKISKYVFHDFSCKWIPRPDINDQATQKCMNGNGEIRELSYSLSNGEVIPLIDYCFDINTSRTAWAYTKIHPWIPVFTSKMCKPRWMNEFLFPGISQKSLYIEENQAKSFFNILGRRISSLGEGKGMTLSRGHLVAKTDMYYPVQRKDTYDYANILPQWACINNGNWREIENVVRRLVDKQEHYLDVWTGGLGIMQMKNRYHKLQNLYLNRHMNENPQPRSTPVPSYFFKIVYDRFVNQGIVFVVINNPFLGEAEVMNLIICKNICDEIPIMHEKFRNFWKRVKYGYTYCCEIKEFLNQNPLLIEHDFSGTTLLRE